MKKIFIVCREESHEFDGSWSLPLKAFNSEVKAKEYAELCFLRHQEIQETISKLKIEEVFKMQFINEYDPSWIYSSLRDVWYYHYSLDLEE